jgi:ubiquinone/menaquinone biosynthesis C-methylase UbiE
MQIKNSNSYVLGVGEQGQERLAILNEIFNPTSQLLLLQAGLIKGQQVLEIGCGTGVMTCWMAEQVGANGHVYAVDISSEQLEIAQQLAREKNLKNITFICRSVYDLDDLPLFDLIYSRFIIMHLKQPFAALKIMSCHLKNGGNMVCEEASNQTAYCYPEFAAFKKYRQLLMSLGAQKELDYSLGDKIYSYFLDLQFKNIFTHFIQPIYQNKRQKIMMPLLIREIKNNLIAAQLANESEIDKLIYELNEFTEENKYLVSFSRTMQIFGMSSN